MAARGSKEWRENTSRGVSEKERQARSSRSKKLWEQSWYRSLMTEIANRKKPSKFDGVDLRALQNFKGMHNRARDGKVPSIQWPRSKEGYVAFLDEIGPKPDDGQKWSVGRIDHHLGYQVGNVRWELHTFNSSNRPYGQRRKLCA